MGRPRKPEWEKLEDAFYDATATEQAGVLDRLELLHRLKLRQPKPAAKAPAPAPAEAAQEAKA